MKLRFALRFLPCVCQRKMAFFLNKIVCGFTVIVFCFYQEKIYVNVLLTANIYRIIKYRK